MSLGSWTVGTALGSGTGGTSLGNGNGGMLAGTGSVVTGSSDAIDRPGSPEHPAARVAAAIGGRSSATRHRLRLTPTTIRQPLAVTDDAITGRALEDAADSHLIGWCPFSSNLGHLMRSDLRCPRLDENAVGAISH